MLRSLPAAALVFLAGCAGDHPKLATVRGTVTFRGQPLPGGQLRVKSLAPDAQVQTNYTSIKADGRFVLTEAPVGPALFAVDTTTVRDEAVEPGEKPRLRYVAIPKRYASFDAAGLAVEIRRGEQTHDFDLGP